MDILQDLNDLRHDDNFLDNFFNNKRNLHNFILCDNDWICILDDQFVCNFEDFFRNMNSINCFLYFFLYDSSFNVSFHFLYLSLYCCHRNYLLLHSLYFLQPLQQDRNLNDFLCNSLNIAVHIYNMRHDLFHFDHFRNFNDLIHFFLHFIDFWHFDNTVNYPITHFCYTQHLLYLYGDGSNNLLFERLHLLDHCFKVGLLINNYLDFLLYYGSFFDSFNLNNVWIWLDSHGNDFFPFSINFNDLFTDMFDRNELFPFHFNRDFYLNRNYHLLIQENKVCLWD